MKNVMLMLLAAMCCLNLHAQQDGKAELKSITKPSLAERKAVSYAPLREADVVYAKQLHRIIDTREKKNMVMNYPKSHFGNILLGLVRQGEDGSSGRVKVYQYDTSANPMKIEEVRKKSQVCEIIRIPNPENPGDIYDYIDTTVCRPFDGRDIRRYEIVEEWLFDKQRGIFFPRIIAIAPLYHPTANGIELPEQPMFFVRYADLRKELIHEELFNRQNDGARLTYYDFFEQRMFSSYISRESNVQDLAINQLPGYKDDPKRALYKAEEIKEALFNWEHDLWEY